MTARLARAGLVVAALAWGLTFVANHELLQALAPQEITVLRFSAVAVAFAVLLASRPALRPRFEARHWALLAGCGLLAVPGSQLALTHGQRFLSPAMSGLVVATGPAFVAVLAAVLLGERTTRRAWAGIVVAFAGAAVVTVFATGTGTDLTVRDPRGAALVVLAQLCWAGSTVVAARLVRRHHPVTVVGVTIVLGAAWLLPAAPAAVRAAGELDLGQLAWLVHLAGFGTVVPYLLWFGALRRLPANEVGAFSFLIPLFAIGWSAVLLDERPVLAGLSGGAMILAGVAATQLGRPATGPTAPAPAVPVPVVVPDEERHP